MLKPGWKESDWVVKGHSPRNPIQRTEVPNEVIVSTTTGVFSKMFDMFDEIILKSVW